MPRTPRRFTAPAAAPQRTTPDDSPAASAPRVDPAITAYLEGRELPPSPRFTFELDPHGRLEGRQVMYAVLSSSGSLIAVPLLAVAGQIQAFNGDDAGTLNVTLMTGEELEAAFEARAA